MPLCLGILSRESTRGEGDTGRRLLVVEGTAFKRLPVIFG